MSKFQIGQQIVVKPHTRYQHLSHGAIIVPPIRHDLLGYKSTIFALYMEELGVGLDGKEVLEPVIVSARGEELRPSEIELI